MLAASVTVAKKGKNTVLKGWCVPCRFHGGRCSGDVPAAISGGSAAAPDLEAFPGDHSPLLCHPHSLLCTVQHEFVYSN